MTTDSIDLDLDLADRARVELGDAVREFLTQRTAVDSPLFDVSTKMVYGNYASVRSIPLLMDLVNARATPAEIGARLKTMGVPLGLVMNGLGWVLTMGRIQLYLDAGWPVNPAPVVEEDARAAEVFTWWARIMQVYRNDGQLVPGQGGAPATFEVLPDDQVATVAQVARSDGAVAADNTIAGGGAVDMLRRSIAELDMFEFVTHAEARDGIHQHGPYDIGDGRTILFKEFTDLQGKYMPDKTEDLLLPVSRVVVALVLRNVMVRFDIFAIFAEPENVFDHLDGVAIYVDDDLHQISVPELAEITASAVTAQRTYFLKMANWDDRTKVTHCASQYANDFHALLLLAGYSDDEIVELWVDPFEKNALDYFDRATSPERLAVFGHLMGDAQPVTPPIPH
ncbi:MAG: hypothetical protein QM662_18005 [Gordonia sp. (in: high G+C Gram-positive bacteria)]